eukprot:m.34709 g.34709  ORF g.34709 m.34709 type:complete len:79 (+) comp17021_c0_seq1:2394-2630(+)
MVVVKQNTFAIAKENRQVCHTTTSINNISDQQCESIYICAFPSARLYNPVSKDFTKEFAQWLRYDTRSNFVLIQYSRT